MQAQPHNPATGAVYQGANAAECAAILLALGSTDTRFTTFRGARQFGLTVPKGCKAIAKLCKVTEKTDRKGQKRFVMKRFAVWHWSQLEPLAEEKAA